MKFPKITFYLLLLLAAILLSACSGQVSGSWPGLTSNGDRAYLAFHQYVYAVDLNTGQMIWRFPEKPESNINFFAPPALTPQGRLIVGSYALNGAKPRLYSLDAKTGQIHWVFENATNHFIASPLVTDQGIYAPNADGSLYALGFDMENLWIYPTDRGIWASPTTDEDCTCIYFASMDHRLYKVNAQTGEEEWKTTDLGGALAGPPTYHASVLFQGTSNNQMLALDAASKENIWTFQTEGWVWSGAAYDDGVVYFGDLKGNVYAVNASTGEKIWAVKADGAIVSKPLVYKGLIYYTTETANIYAVDKQGTLQWRQETPAKIYGPVVAAGDMILVALTDLKNPLLAYDLNGNLKWTFSVPEK